MELPDKPNHATLEERREKLDERARGWGPCPRRQRYS